MIKITASEIVETIELTLKQQKCFDFDGMVTIVNVVEAAKKTISERDVLIKRDTLAKKEGNGSGKEKKKKKQ